MSRDARLSGALHVLLHLAHQPTPLTSEVLARALQTNPVVLRRLLGGLRDAGYVCSEKGHGGGWRLACDLAQVSLLDVHRALGSPAMFAVGLRSGSPHCRVERAVNASLHHALHEAEQVLLERLGQVTLATLAAEVHSRGKSCHPPFDLAKTHGETA